MTLSWREDGTPDTWHVTRNATPTPINVVDRSYEYWTDGMTKGWTSTVAADPGRRFFYDGGNRLTCSTVDTGASSCPPNGDGDLIESYVYDISGNRTSAGTKYGTTTYTLTGNTITQESLPGSRTIVYDYEYPNGGGRTYDEETTEGVDANRRDYFFDGIGRVRSITLPVPTTVGNYDQHSITILYDHLSRPIYVADLNHATERERRVNYYWDRSDRLIARFTTPNHTKPTTYDVDMYAHVDDIVTGTLRLQYEEGFIDNEDWLLDARDVVGLPIARWEFTWTGSTMPVWSDDYAPFGERLNSPPVASDPPWGFRGQLLLAGSESLVWSGSTLTERAGPVRLNQWRVYDHRVGQYTTAEPLALNATLRQFNSYQYVEHAPLTTVDPTGQGPLDELCRWLRICDPPPCRELCNDNCTPPCSPAGCGRSYCPPRDDDCYCNCLSINCPTDFADVAACAPSTPDAPPEERPGPELPPEPPPWLDR